jgi:hypothetical protein
LQIFLVHKITSEQECAILTTLYLAGAKNTNMAIWRSTPEYVGFLLLR